jgi:hypothetical protein
MERENIGQGVEFSAQNAYSSGMAESSGEFNSGTPQAPRPQVSPDQAQANLMAWENYVRNQGETITPDMRQGFISASRMGLVPPNSSTQSEIRPDNIDTTSAYEEMLARAVQKGVEQASSMDRRSKGRGKREIPEIQPLTTERVFTNPKLITIVTNIRMAGGDLLKDPIYIDELIVMAEKVKTENPAASEEAQELINYLDNVRKDVEDIQANTTREARSTFQLSLTTEDMDSLQTNPMEWLDNQFDRLYSVATEGQELDSPIVGAIQNQVEAASRFLGTTAEGKSKPELIQQFNAGFINRLNLLFARSSIEQRNMEGISGLSKRIQAHGILNTLTFENNLVNKMHNRINEVYDDIRITLPQQHITPEEHAQIQQKVIDEYYKLVNSDEELLKELGITEYMSDTRKEKIAKASIKRAVRTAYDHFVASQREAVIVARGEALPTEKSLEGILADPSGLFMMFNYEQLLVSKFNLLNHAQAEFFSAIKRRYAESVLKTKFEKEGGSIDSWVRERVNTDPSIKEEAHEHHMSLKDAALVSYGTDLIKDLMLVNDFYSSPWRLDQFMKQLDEYMLYQFALKKGVKISDLDEGDRKNALKQAGDFALFMRLRQIHGSTTTPPKEKPAAKEAVWGKIATYRPEDIVRLFREHEGLDSNGKPELEKVNNAFKKILGGQELPSGSMYYDKFKEKYAGALRLIREKGFEKEPPEQIDFSNISSYPRYVDLLNKMLGEGEAQKIEELYKTLKEFAGDQKTIKKLMNDVRFGYVYSRAYTVDDGLLNKMEIVDESKGLKTALSRKLSVESGGDAYVRAFNDATVATEGHTAFLSFLMAESPEEKLKAARTAAASTKRYASPAAGAMVFRQLYGNYLLMGNVADGNWFSMRTIYETFDLKNLPFNRRINELQRIFGPHAKVYNHDEMTHFLNEFRDDLTKSGHDKKEAEALWWEMRRLAKTRPHDDLRFKAGRALIYAMLAILLSGYITVSEGLKSEDLN